MSIIQTLSAGGVAPAADANAASLVAALPLSHQFGFNDQSHIVRSSGLPATVVNYFDAGAEITIQSSQSKFYGSSARKPQTSPAGTTFRESHIDVNTGSGTQFGTGDFCIEAWFYTEDFAFAAQGTHGFLFPLWRNNNANTYGYVPYISILGDNWGTAGERRGLRVRNPEDTSNFCQTPGAVFSSSTWHHVAITRSGTTVRVFVDGVEQASGSMSTNWTGYEYWFFDTTRTLGSAFHIQDIRIYKGAAKYTSGFTPPSAMFV
jgi:hypothetical protein